MLRKIGAAIKLFREKGLWGAMSVLKRRYNSPLPISSKGLWKNSIKSEVAFWNSYLLNKGGQWSDGYKRRFDPHLPLQPRPASLLPDAAEIRILDVGAGPLTYLGKVMEGKNLHIQAVDALAGEYDKLLDKYDLEPLVRTQQVDAEKLTDRFSPNSFDLVFARNCIDHSYSPELAIKQMLTVLKKGCYVLMEHHPSEAEKQNYTGLHQWNFSMSDSGEFIITSAHATTNVNKKFSDLCTVNCELISEAGENWLISRLRKK